MPEEPLTQQPISDDQELAKVLAGVSQDADDAVTTQDTQDIPEPVVIPPINNSESILSTPEPAVTVSADSELDSIKLAALNELRPLVDKLNVSPEEKFDTYLLLLRSTDDRDLIAPAHDAAKNIADEARRAQALLDIIKEIDFLSQSTK